MRTNPATALERRVAWVVTVIPLAGFVLAIVVSWNRGGGVLELALCLGFSLATILGITAGYHRLFTH